MNLYQKEQVFSTRTGKPCGEKWMPCGKLCDFCGKPIEEQPGEVTYTIYEPGDIEPGFNDLRLTTHPDISSYEIFNADNPFVYCQDWDNEEFCERKMLDTWAKNRKKKTVNMISHIMYDARIAMLDKILESGRTLAELGLE